MVNAKPFIDILGEERWSHRWGFADTEFVVEPEIRGVRLTGDRYDIAGKSMPYLVPFLEDQLGVSLDLTNLRPEVQDKPIAPPIRNDAFCRAVSDAFPETSYSFDDALRLRHSHGQTIPTEVLKVRYDQLERFVDMVFFCTSSEDSETLVNLAVQHDVCLVPYGGGTSVSGALTMPAEETRMIVAVNMRRMNRVEWIDEENLQACVQAGITGRQLEEELGKAGYTCGHHPDSVEFSTLGGWISTNASGMKKNRYGNIEDIVESVTLLTPGGLIDQHIAMPRMAIGMQLQKLLFGSEGNLGIITKAVIRINPVPEACEYSSAIFPDFKTGAACLKELSQTNFVPASIRLVDHNQLEMGRALNKFADDSARAARRTKIQNFVVEKIFKLDVDRMVSATIVMEGSKEEVDYQAKNIKKLVKKYGGIIAGSKVGRRGYRLTQAIAYLRDILSALYIIGDACETTVPWSRVDEMVEAMEQTLAEQHKRFNLPGKPFLTYRITQLYKTSVCVYFMNGFYHRGIENPEAVMQAIDYAMKECVVKYGGSLSHHHGVGKLRQDFLKDTVSPTAINLLKKVKEVNDPTNTFGIRNNVFAIDSSGS